MTPSFLASGLSFGLQNATAAGWVICILLLMLSIASWVAMTIKFFALKRARLANGEFRTSLFRSPHPLALFQIGERFQNSPMFETYYRGCRELSFYLLGTDEVDSTFALRLQSAGRITPSEMNVVREAMERSVNAAVVKLESRLGVVATALSSAPVLGLLGTVWGVMESFGGIAGTVDSTGLSALAPGLSSAMLTTIAGLIVALPSMFGYNYLVSRIRDQIARLDHFAADFASIMDRHFVDHRTTAPELAAMGDADAVGADAFSAPPTGFTTAPSITSAT
jgi:biopolymer transport protein ExbB/TolQ